MVLVARVSQGLQFFARSKRAPEMVVYLPEVTMFPPSPGFPRVANFPRVVRYLEFMYPEWKSLLGDLVRI